MDLFIAVRFLAVADPGPSRRQLDVSTLEHLNIAHRIVAKLFLINNSLKGIN